MKLGRKYLTPALALSLLAAPALAQSVITTGFDTSDGFTTGTLNPGTTLDSGDFSVTFTDGQQQQMVFPAAYNVGPAGFLFVNDPPAVGVFESTGDVGTIDFGQGSTEVSFFAANLANGAATTFRAIGTDGTTVLGSVAVTQTNIQAANNPELTVFNALELGGLIGSIEVDLPGPIANAPYIAAIDTFSATRASFLDESVNGDFSSDGTAPTPITFGLGSNIIGGSVNSANGAGEVGSDSRDFITFTLGPGQTLASINLLDFDDPTTPAPNDADTGFFALVEGDSSVDPGGGFPNLGGVELEAGQPFGEDLLAQIADGGVAGGSGFTEITDGTFTLIIQQTGPETSNYLIDVNVVPEPSSALLLTSLAGCFGLVRRRS